MQGELKNSTPKQIREKYTNNYDFLKGETITTNGAISIGIVPLKTNFKFRLHLFSYLVPEEHLKEAQTKWQERQDDLNRLHVIPEEQRDDKIIKDIIKEMEEMKISLEKMTKHKDELDIYSMDSLLYDNIARFEKIFKKCPTEEIKFLSDMTRDSIKNPSISFGVEGVLAKQTGKNVKALYDGDSVYIDVDPRIHYIRYSNNISNDLLIASTLHEFMHFYDEKILGLEPNLLEKRYKEIENEFNITYKGAEQNKSRAFSEMIDKKMDAIAAVTSPIMGAR